MRKLTLAAIQFTPSDDVQENIDRVADYVRDAASKGADVVLPPELFCGYYFCKTQEEEHFARAYPWNEHPAVVQLAELAAELGVVIPVSIYEKDGPHYYNSLVMLDADGAALGVYRKSHIPDGPGYQEKYYFRPGDTGFRVWETMKGRIGVGICWDQWFPEAARSMALMGADALLYPTAIGSEPQDSSLDTAARWRRAMQGHAVSNTIPVVAANRVGNEEGQIFYGTSFIADQTGEIVTDFDRAEQGVLLAEFDLDDVDRERAAWGFFRDRRTDLYDGLV
ncbi:N-carbamoylputrescine amidase [Hyphomonas pacifica]|uniref:N-carbamoylputrescine amidase n=1 Tax=Hyphomonas pacifica TaxID=1280941 RepID=A0A062UA17_9PROT|nr:N-carbamoylputrescine amidase [Hyphomonas pacifica]KCZ53000.1 N-carbamoylputrescine amidase [Hyphomonas pacifica]RAN36141.1 N-carbamoylputrescine amidase [Hyphomonas pacifica]RAN37845.1 N-carbamoylputrescine amidase [Hyphomonas pacifica]